MARPGYRLDYPRRKETIRFVQTAASSAGEVVEMEVEALPAGGIAPPLHSHPRQEEEFNVISGTLAYRIGGRDGVAGPGTRAIVPAGVAHTWWNGGDEPLVMKGCIRPALRFETFLETVYGIHGPEYADRSGNASLVRMAVVIREFRDEWTPEFLPLAVRRFVLPVLALVGRLRGYRWWYPQFSPDGPVQLRLGQARRSRPGSVRHEVVVAYLAPAVIASAAAVATRQRDLQIAAPTWIALTSALAALTVGLFYGGERRHLAAWPRAGAAAVLAVATTVLAAAITAVLVKVLPHAGRLWIDVPLSAAIGGAISGWRLHRTVSAGASEPPGDRSRLGDVIEVDGDPRPSSKVERETGFEPATSTLGKLRSTD